MPGSPTHGSSDSKNTKASRLVDRLREAILSGELRPGTKINLDAVRRELDVSLSPLREALARLIAVGLVELHDNKGYSVAPVSLSNLAEITRLRVEFESLALSSAIAHGDLSWESDVMRALHRLNRTERVAGDPATLEAWEHAHRDFHMTLIRGCGMPLLLNFCAMLHNLNDRYRRVFLVAQGGDRNVAAEHSEIAQGAVARDGTYACEKLREHILRTGTNLRARLSDQLQP
ncbi:DNA-binding GntR family transcriptional regulator [Bosea sp. BE125]|uniref:GntR family transcriptional regulator n=1 Tax=Bosea sp. BE125 TaxID=2817909 RepID=UPI002859818A|nr:GntR family transcriptional regulator [Bosea sp. BE125]MDR6872486.1 DNA-binding GntR family transcriptional regulator [Bosea sp. BE125]